MATDEAQKKASISQKDPSEIEHSIKKLKDIFDKKMEQVAGAKVPDGKSDFAWGHQQAQPGVHRGTQVHFHDHDQTHGRKPGGQKPVHPAGGRLQENDEGPPESPERKRGQNLQNQAAGSGGVAPGRPVRGQGKKDPLPHQGRLRTVLLPGVHQLDQQCGTEQRDVG